MPNVTISANFGEPNNSTIPTDDPYGSLYNNSIPSTVVARIPGTSADNIASMLNNIIEKHQATQNNNLLIVGDGINSTHDSFLQADMNSFSLDAANLACNSNTNCLYAPPNCLTHLCSNSAALNSDISTQYGIQFYVCHGDGYGCGNYYMLYPNQDYSVISTTDVPNLQTLPIIILEACYDGAIYGYPSEYYTNLIGETPLAIEMLDKGATAYIGNTKEGYGGITPTEEEYIYNDLKSGKTIGQAFLSMKQYYLTHPYDSYYQGTAQELQLYGDPTLTMS
jgi:hypothetical protein